MKLKSFLRIGVVLLFITGVAVPTQALTALHFDSDLFDLIGKGQSLTATPDQGFDFLVWQRGSGLSFTIRKLDPADTQWWTLTVAPPLNESLAIGSYENATSAGNDPNPELSFFGNGSAYNRSVGYFEVLDLGYNAIGELQHFAVDFVQYKTTCYTGCNEPNYNKGLYGSFRYNSDIPLSNTTVPEPTTLSFFAIGVLCLYSLKRRYVKR